MTVFERLGSYLIRAAKKIWQAINDLPVEEMLESEWAQRIGKDALNEFVRLSQQASTMSDMSGRQKRDWVIAEMQNWALSQGKNELVQHLNNPTIIALIELIYAKYVQPQQEEITAVG
jgi:hypothetical protein